MTTRLIPNSSLTTFRDSLGLRVSPQNEGTTASRRAIRRSSRDIAQRAANGDFGARMHSMPIDEVESALANTWVDEGEVSLLSLLEDPDRNKAEAVKEILVHMSDYAEEHTLQMALVWRYAKEHEVWKSCTNPDWRTEDSFLNSLDGHQTTRLCIQFGTSTDAARRGKMNIIQRNWGAEWYARALQRSLFPESQRTASRLSKSMLRDIAGASRIISLNNALDFLEKAIQKRTAVGSRTALGWKAAITPHVMPCDLKALLAHVDEIQSTSVTGPSCSEDEILELRSSEGFSSLSPFESRSRAKAKKQVAGEVEARSAPSKEQKRKQSRARRSSGQEQCSKADERKSRGRQSDHINNAKDLDGQSKGRYNRNDDPRNQRETDGDAEDARGREAARSAESAAGRDAEGEAQEASCVDNAIRADITGATLAAKGADDFQITKTGTLRVEVEHASATAAMTSHSNKRKHVALSPFGGESSREKKARSLDSQEGAGEINTAQHARDGNGDETEAEAQSIPSLALGHQQKDAGPATQYRDPPSATTSSVRDFTYTVVDGSALESLDEGDRATTQQSDEDATLFQKCLTCCGKCSRCEIPRGFDESQQRKLSDAAHRALDLETKGPHKAMHKWIKPVRYARQNIGLLQGPGEFCVLTAQSFMSQIRQGRALVQPLVIKEDFADSAEWTLARYADQLDVVFGDMDVDVRSHRDPEPAREVVSHMVDLCRATSHSLTGNPPNMLNLPDITGALSPSFLRADRFRLLDLIVERCKAEASYRLGKQLHLSPFDTGSCRKFNIFGWPGAFSGAHVDSNGSTWVRNLFGYKLWMFVPETAMTSADWEQFAHDGDDWDPGDKARAVILEPGDVFVMRAGLVHAVLTLGDTSPSLMTGGCFWDDQDLLHTLQTYFKIGRSQCITNEAIAYQSAQIVASLGSIVERNPQRFCTDEDFLDKYRQYILDIRSLGCECSTCDEGCRCAQDGRRCTPLCKAHTFADVDSKVCMSEQTGTVDSDQDSSDGEKNEN